MLMQPLKTILLFSTFAIFISLQTQAQSRNYEKEWKQVNTLMEKQLPKSALEEVRKIYQLAKKEKQDAQIIKALVYMTGLQRGLTENGEVKAIAEIESEIKTANEPAK